MQQLPRTGRGSRSYHPLTNDYFTWLTQYIDLYDWGYRDHRTSAPTLSATSGRLEEYLVGLRYPPTRFSRRHLQSHLAGTDKLYYTSLRHCGFALVKIDIDAHKGQTDALHCADFLIETCFPGAYLEPSPRGQHVYVLVRVGYARRSVFNDAMRELQRTLRELVAFAGFRSTVDVMGDFTILNENRTINRRGKLAAIPLLHAGEADLDRLRRAPVMLPTAIVDINRRGRLARDLDGMETTPSVLPDVYVSSGRVVPTRHSHDAWERMQWACFDFTVANRRLPTVDELLEYYRRVYDTDDGTAARRRRAVDAIKYRSMTFDPSRAADGGYELCRDRLLEAVRRYCVDRTHNCETKITDEDLAIALYVVMLNSFGAQVDPQLQWTCPNACFTGMFKALNAAGVTTRLCGKRNKVVAIKQILERAQLIECIDRKWVCCGGRPRGKKYHIGVNHWRYAEFVRFSQGVDVRYVKGRVCEGNLASATVQDRQLTPAS